MLPISYKSSNIVSYAISKSLLSIQTVKVSTLPVWNPGSIWSWKIWKMASHKYMKIR